MVYAVSTCRMALGTGHFFIFQINLKIVFMKYSTSLGFGTFASNSILRFSNSSAYFNATKRTVSYRGFNPIPRVLFTLLYKSDRTFSIMGVSTDYINGGNQLQVNVCGHCHFVPIKTTASAKANFSLFTGLKVLEQ